MWIGAALAQLPARAVEVFVPHVRDLLRPMVHVAVLWGAVLVAAPGAHAESALVELGSFTSREEADAAAQVMHTGIDQVGLGDAATVRVVRRFERGLGWRFVVIAEQLPDVARAEALAAQVGTVAVPAKVIALDGRARTVVGEVAPTPVGTVQTASGPRLPSADTVLRQVAKAAGGKAAGATAVAAAGSLRFTFRRDIDTGDGALSAENVYERMGDARRLDVKILAGDGQDSTTVLTLGGKGYVQTADALVARDAARVSEVLDMFSPETVLGVPLQVGGAGDRPAGWDTLVVHEKRTESGREVYVLAMPRDVGAGGVSRRSSLMGVGIDVQRRTVSWTEWESPGGRVRFVYDDYRLQEQGVLVPHRVLVQRDGATLETLTITGLQLDPALTVDRFSAPAGAEVSDPG